jgi:hypothetical protein
MSLNYNVKGGTALRTTDSRAVMARAHVVNAVALGAACASLLIYLTVGVLRATSPLPLDDVELAVVSHIGRILAGLPLFAEPTSRFVPLAYTPIFYYVSAAVSALGLPGFAGPRLVSLGAACVALVVIYRLVVFETGSRRAGVLAAGLGTAVGGDVGWLALARVDTLMGCLALCGFYVLRTRVSAAGALSAGVLFGLAALTKQTSLVTFAALWIWLLWRDRRRGLTFGAGCAATIVVLAALWEWRSAGWFAYYVVYVSMRQGAGDIMAAIRLGVLELVQTVPFTMLGVAALGIGSIRRRLGLDGDLAGAYGAALIGNVAAAAASGYVHASLQNPMLPACAFLILIFAICGARIASRSARERDEGLAVALSVVYIAQFAALAYAPAKLLPTADSLRRGGNAVVTVSGTPIADHARRWLRWSATSPVEYADRFATEDLVRGGSAEVIDAYRAAVRDALCGATPGAPVVIDAELLAPEMGIVSGLGDDCGAGTP